MEKPNSYTHSIQEKLKAVKQHIKGEKTTKIIAQNLNISVSTLRNWCELYELFGIDGLAAGTHKQKYSAEVKTAAVEDYLSKKYTEREIRKKYNIYTKGILNDWVKEYNKGIALKDSKPRKRRRCRMPKAPATQTTAEERLEIANYCINHNKDYTEAAKIFGISRQQAYRWTREFILKGKAGLDDRRGKNLYTQEPRNEKEELLIEIARLKHQVQLLTMERDLLKKAKEMEGRVEHESILNESKYLAIKDFAKNKNFSVASACAILGIARSAYYQWRNKSHRKSKRERENERIADIITDIHEQHPDKGYRRLRDDIVRYKKMNVNDKRILRICRILGVKSSIKYRPYNRDTKHESGTYVAENILNRNFKAEKPNEKWLTDVTEFKWYDGVVVHKIYLSAILDLYDRRIVSFQISDRNDNQLVFDTFDNAMKIAEITSKVTQELMLHSDRGYQYTSKQFHRKLTEAGITQSMSRPGHCIDNGPMEGFWGILKREKYYGRTFYDRQELVSMIEEYIYYYNFGRVQRNLGIKTPMQKHREYRMYPSKAA